MIGEHSIKVSEAEQGLTVIDLLAQRLDISRRHAKSMLDARKILINGRRVWMARQKLRRGDLIEIIRDPCRDRALIPDLIHRDQHYIIADKPAGMLANGAASLEQALRRELRNPALRAAHRLDRDTTGCLLLACNGVAFDAATQLFRKREIAKTYRVIVRGRMARGNRSVRTRIDHRSAVSHIKVLSANAVASYVQVQLETGRTHQIRRHLEGLGHPVIGDKAYGTGAAVDPRIRQVPRQMLHAHSLAFTSPLTGQELSVQSRLPPDFRAILADLRLADRRSQ
jgi:23S rRNA pseudouridine1911/1915/1917 synthase